jgi:hypothetical protein
MHEDAQKRTNKKRSRSSHSKRTKKQSSHSKSLRFLPSPSLHQNKKRFISTDYPSKSTGSQRVFFRTIQNTIRTIKDNVKTDPKYNDTDRIFNELFKPAEIFKSIIKKIQFSNDHKPLFYCEINIKKTTLEPHDSYTQELDKLLSRDEDTNGHYFVRMVGKNEGHSICIYKEGLTYVVYDSNDYTKDQYAWSGTKILVNFIKTNDQNIVESGYQRHKHQPMRENICTMFALYAWLIGPVPERQANANINSKVAKQYLLALLNDLKDKFFAYKDDIQMLRLYTLIVENIIANSQQYA